MTSYTQDGRTISFRRKICLMILIAAISIKILLGFYFLCRPNLLQYPLRFQNYLRSANDNKSTTCPDEQLNRIRRLLHVRTVSCKNILAGDKSEVDRAVKLVKGMEKKMLSNTYYWNLTENCELFLTQRGYVTCSLTQEESDFPIAFSMLVYKDIEMVERLLRSIYRPQNYYCIHVDGAADRNFLKAVSSLANCFTNVFLTPERYNVNWGTMTVLEPELLCMEYLWKYKKWKYFINLTGQEFPLKTNWELVQILKAYNGANDLEVTMKSGRDRWSTEPPHNLTAGKGSVHIAVNRDYVDYILHSPIAADLLRWVNGTLIPDETYFATLNHNPQLGIRGTYKGVPESDLDNSTVKPFLTRFKNWAGANRYPCAGNYTRSICILTTGDLPILAKAKHMFANKFFLREDPIVIGCLEEMIINNTILELRGDKCFNSTYYSQLGFVLNQVR